MSKCNRRISLITVGYFYNFLFCKSVKNTFADLMTFLKNKLSKNQIKA